MATSKGSEGDRVTNRCGEFERYAERGTELQLDCVRFAEAHDTSRTGRVSNARVPSPANTASTTARGATLRLGAGRRRTERRSQERSRSQ
jgi:hypothetical protein